IYGLINFVHISLYISFANLYDILHMRRKKQLRKNPEAKETFNPKVTVLIPAHNEQLGIIRCLETVSKSTYKNISIVVIDDASSDRTSRLVREFINKHSSRVSSRFVLKDGKTKREYFRTESNIPPICLLTRPVNSGKASGLNYALKYAVDDGLTMTLDADSALDPKAIQNAVNYFRDPKVVGVAANVKVMSGHNVVGMLQKFEHMIGYRSKKFYTMTNCEFVIGGVASTYRYNVLKEVGFYDTDTATEDIGLSTKIAAHGNRDWRLVYASDVVASTEGVQSFKALLKQRYRWKLGTLQILFKYRYLLGNLDRKYSRSLTWYRFPMAFFSEIMLVLQPFLLAFVILSALGHHSLSALMGGYFTITLYVLWSLWPDEHYSVKEKLMLSMYAPVMYFIFFLMDFVQVNAIFKCLANYRQFTKLERRNVTWVSPERVGSVQPAV
ncbi:MAG TPA: glycosyltransferase family 2 protein, partial [Candidatus Saccharimonadales bacterium]|nr:glycosyltransferase family 2 protein [Candidatus Saccharimonadales bacterium]